MSGIFLEVPMISVTLFSGLYWGEPKSKLRRGRVRGILGVQTIAHTDLMEPSYSTQYLYMSIL